MGNMEHRQGNLGAARDRFLESCEIAERMGDIPGIMGCYNNLALIAYRSLDYEDASQYAQRALGLARLAGDGYAEGCASYTIGLIALASGNLDNSRSYLARSLVFREQAGDGRRLLESIEAVARLADKCSQPHVANCLLVAAETLRTQMRIPRPPIEQDEIAPLIEFMSRTHVDSRQFELARAESASWTLSKAVTESLRFAEQRTQNILASMRNNSSSPIVI